MNEIPLIQSDDIIEFCREHKGLAIKLIRSTRKTLGVFSDSLSFFCLPLADHLAKKWLTKTKNPYLQEIQEIANILKISGIFALNLSYEWGCSTRGFEDNSILRVLDWPFPGLGESVFVVHTSGPAGDYYNITWPATTGVFQGMAPNRFCAAINQAPMRSHGLTIFGDWLKNRSMVYKHSALPPAHLLREVFEKAANYQQAKKILSETPLCIPVIYTLVGTNPGESAIIERLENNYFIYEQSSTTKTSTTNHFQSALNDSPQKKWLPRPIDSHGRLKQINSLSSSDFSDQNFTYLSFPVINKDTKLCMIANAASNALIVQGLERDGQATKIFNLNKER